MIIFKNYPRSELIIFKTVNNVYCNVLTFLCILLLYKCQILVIYIYIYIGIRYILFIFYNKNSSL